MKRRVKECSEPIRIVIPPERLAAALSMAFTKPLLKKLDKESDKRK